MGNTSRIVANLGAARSNVALDGFRSGRPAAFKTMTELCGCALSECRAFQALVHNGTITSSDDYEEYISPPFACKRDDCDGLYDDLVHHAIEKEVGAECVACELGVEDLESGMYVTMETATGNVLTLEVAFEECDNNDEAMLLACETAVGIGYRRGDDPADGSYCFLNCRCMVSQKKGRGNSDDEEEEAESTDDDFVPDEDEVSDDTNPTSSEEEEGKRVSKRSRQ